MLASLYDVLIGMGIAIVGGYFLYYCLRRTAYHTYMHYRRDDFLIQVRPYKRPVPYLPFCLACGVLLFVLYLHGDPDGQSHPQHVVMILAFVWCLIALAWLDLKFMILPTSYILVFFAVYVAGRTCDYIHLSWILGILPQNAHGAWLFFEPYIVHNALPAVIAWGVTQVYFRWADKQQRHPGIGEGDRNLLLVLWFWFAPHEWVIAFFLATVLFLIAVLFSSQKREPKPFGPAIVCSAILLLFYAIYGG